MSSHPSRRNAIKALSLTVTSCAAGGPATRRAPAAANPVVEENRKPGTRDWLLRNPQVSRPHPLWHMFGLRSAVIEGYASHASIRAGETLRLHVSSNPASAFGVDVFRMGYYGGAGARRVATLGPFPGRTQPEPEIGANRVAACAWEPSAEITIPADWLSGVYLARLTELAHGADSYVVFVVRDDRRADLLFQTSDMTWQAYNRWPYNNSLYCDGTRDWHTGPGVDVSVDRPYGKYTQLVDQPLSTGSGEWLLWEFPMAFWLEQHGYDVSYVSNWDTHRDGGGLLRGKGFLSVGHDEYWTQAMFDNTRSAIAAGVNVGFFSANSVFCKVALKPDAAGARDRVFTRAGRFAPRENTLIGAHSHGPVIGGADWTCQRPDHWIFAGTGMKKGEGIPGLVGWEFHSDPAPLPGLEVVASATTDGRRFPARETGGSNGMFTATVHPGPASNFVFNAATCWWTDGLAAPPGYLRSDWYRARRGPDERVQRITRNILDRMTRG